MVKHILLFLEWVVNRFVYILYNYVIVQCINVVQYNTALQSN